MSNFDEFKRVVAKSIDIPMDLQLLFEATESGLESPFSELGLSCVSPGEESEINDISYLSEEELKKPDIQSNIEATNYVAKLARFVAKDDERNLYGYWLGYGSKAISSASILMYDNEGQFRMLPGSSLVEAVSWNYSADDDDTFSDLKEKFEKIGITFSADDCESYYEIFPTDADEPKSIHIEIYSAERVKRGLTPL